MHLITFLVVVVVLIYIYISNLSTIVGRKWRDIKRREKIAKKILRDSLFIAIYGLKRTKNFIYLFI